MKKKIFILSLITGLYIWLGTNAFAQTYYVDASAKETTADGSIENPYAKIQTAVDLLQPGDELIVMPGIYYESVTVRASGTPEKPIVIRALKTGEYETVITCANKDIREGKVTWICEDPSTNLYYVPYERNVSSVLYNGAKMFAYKSLEELRTFRCWVDGDKDSPNSMDGFYHGFFYDANAKRLYVQIKNGDKYGDTDPNKNLMAVGGPYYDSVTFNGVEQIAYRRSGISTDSYCMGIVTENSANVIVSGFTFETPGWAGVFCRANDVVIDNCWFKGCFSGIAGGRYNAYDQWESENVTMQNCDWNLWPTFDDGIDAVKSKNSGYTWLWWCVKTTSWGLFDYEAGGVLTQVGKNWNLKDSKISQCLDGISSGCIDGYYVYEPRYGTNWILGGCDGLEISGCKFFDITDNAIESENHGQNINVYNCEFGNMLEAISWQPLDGEPWPSNFFVHHNVFKLDEWFVNMIYEYIPGQVPHWLKIGAGSSAWGRPAMLDKGDMMVGDYPLFPMVLKDKGVWIYNNSVYVPEAYSVQKPGSTSNATQTNSSIRVVNNIIYCRAQPEGRPFRKYILEGNFIGGEVGWWSFRNNMFIQSNPDVDISAEHVGGTEFKTLEEAGVSWNGHELNLEEDSYGIGKGEQVPFEEKDTTDIGAVPYGETWQEIYPGTYIPGDVNRDKIIDLKDVMLLSKNIGKTKAEGQFEAIYDINFDGIINESDLQFAVEGMAE